VHPDVVPGDDLRHRNGQAPPPVVNVNVEPGERLA
jgi:hypothetical protein